MTHVMDQILDDYVSTLQTITTGNGYNRTIQAVYRGDHHRDTIYERPALVVRMGAVEVDPPGLAVTAAISFRMPVDVEIYIGDQDQRTEEVYKIIDDVHTALIADETRGGLAIYTHVTSVDAVIPEGPTEHGISGVVNTTCLFRTEASDLETAV